jgi:hypothetical protein
MINLKFLFINSGLLLLILIAILIPAALDDKFLNTIYGCIECKDAPTCSTLVFEQNPFVDTLIFQTIPTLLPSYNGYTTSVSYNFIISSELLKPPRAIWGFS